MKNVCIRRSRPRSLSKKREAERKAAGETHIHSSIAPSSKPKKLKGHSRPDAKQKRRKPVKAIKKENPERQAKRRKRYSSKLAAYRRSETFKVVEARANERCEAVIDGQHAYAPLFIDAETGTRWPIDEIRRCHNAGNAHHHKSYARFGGNELPRDILKVCDGCHAYFEAQHPTRRNGRRSPQRKEA